MSASSETKITGGCACQAVRYQIDGKPGFSFHCQCRDCQYLSGTGHASAFIVKRERVKLTGDLHWYERTAPSGNKVTFGFCPNCGSPVMNENTGYPSNTFVSPGTLDDPTIFAPTTILYREEGHPWDFTDPEADNPKS